MGITKELLKASTEKYLPRGIYTPLSSSARKDVDKAFYRVKQSLLASLLTDPDSQVYLSHLMCRRLDKVLTSLDTTLASVEDNLRLVTTTDTTRMDGSELDSAVSGLTELSAAVVKGSFGGSHVTKFQSSIESFLTTEVKPNVLAGNFDAQSSALLTDVATLQRDWAEAVERLANLSTLFEGIDSANLAANVSANVVSAIRARILEIQTTLATETLSFHGEQAETIFSDLAAAHALLTKLASPRSATGEVIVAVSEMSTGNDYLLQEGRCTPCPQNYILRGTGGSVVVSPLFTSVSGSITEDGDGDSLTDRLDDSTADFVVDGVEVGNSVVFMATGRMHRVTSVTATRLLIDPKSRIGGTGLRYAVLESAPGTLFEDLEATFWDTFTGGTTPTNVIVSGTGGSFDIMVKASGTDGTNVRTSGVAGSQFPYITSAVNGANSVTDTVTIAGETFLTKGVQAGDKIKSGVTEKTVATVLSETILTTTTNFAPALVNAGYAIYRSGASTQVEDADGAFLSTGVTASDDIVVTSGGQPGTYAISSVDAENYVTTASTFTNETGITWYVPRLAAEFFSATASFGTSDVLVGDLIGITGEGEFQILSVSGGLLEITPDPSANLTAKTFSVYTSATDSTYFQQGTEDFSSGGLDISDTVYFTTEGKRVTTYLIVDSVQYTVARGDPSNTGALYTNETGVVGTGYAWSVLAGDSVTLFTDTGNAPFLDYTVGDILVINPGISEVRTKITEIIDSENIRVADPLTPGLTGQDYAIIHSVRPGMILLVGKNVTTISEVVSATQLTLSPHLSGTLGSDTDYFIFDPGSRRRTNRVTDLSLASGFAANAVGGTLTLLSDSPIVGKVRARLDLDNDGVYETLEFDKHLSISGRALSYTLTQGIARRSKTLQTSTDLSDVLPGDSVSVWGILENFTVMSVGSGELLLNTELPAPITEDFCVLRGAGGRWYGHYLLLLEKTGQLTFSSDTSELRDPLSRVLQDRGLSPGSYYTGSGGSILEDGDLDFESPKFFKSGATFFSSGLRVGDRIVFELSTGSVTSFVTEVIDDENILVLPEVSQDTVLTWEIDRGSLSNSLYACGNLREEVQAILELLGVYVLPSNTGISSTLAGMSEQGMDRSVDLLSDGDVVSLTEVTPKTSSYAGNAVSATSTAGAISLNPANQTKQEVGPGYLGTTLSLPIADLDIQSSLSRTAAMISGSNRVQTQTALTLEELRNRAVYEMTGEVIGAGVEDTDPTLPWVATTGTQQERITASVEAALAAMQYILDNPELFNESE